ncbi:MAG: hypothetical protein LBD14_07025 [Puniceicoccales bacterium]|jgi:hypothetical protein|nr:hypothetical protein [Puniceicoccales bacterium]
MPSEGVVRTGLVLSREPVGERFLKIALLCAEEGVAVCLLRVVMSKKTPASSLPDLFDQAEARLGASSENGARFASDYRVLRRAEGLGSDYARLVPACRLAGVVARNPVPLGSAAAVYALCVEASRAFAGRPRPDVTLFKALWQLARGEGFPVCEHWRRGLALSRQAEVGSVLRQPLDAQTTPPGTVSFLTRELECWLQTHCHFILPPKYPAGEDLA